MHKLNSLLFQDQFGSTVFFFKFTKQRIQTREEVNCSKKKIFQEPDDKSKGPNQKTHGSLKGINNKTKGSRTLPRNIEQVLQNKKAYT
jgi:hypothetical protein